MLIWLHFLSQNNHVVKITKTTHHITLLALRVVYFDFAKPCYFGLSKTLLFVGDPTSWNGGIYTQILKRGLGEERLKKIRSHFGSTQDCVVLINTNATKNPNQRNPKNTISGEISEAHGRINSDKKDSSYGHSLQYFIPDFAQLK